MRLIEPFRRLFGSHATDALQPAPLAGSRGRVPWLSGLSLDLKLGLRMLAKYPGFTLVGGLAMAFAILLGAVTFVLVDQASSPSLPLPGGERVVQVHNWDTQANEEEPRALSDFLAWRQGLRSLTDLGAYRDASVNLIVGRDVGPPVPAAEITANAFRIAPGPPILGRTLLPGDERLDAPPVVVIGYDLWQSRFAGDAGVIGRTVQVGDVHATVIGVMPDGFGFPVAHQLWLPLRIDGIPHGPREGPGIEMFARLAPGATLEQAQAELAAVGRRASADRPETHAHLRPRVRPYAQMGNEDTTFMLLINVFAVMLLVFICCNVALLAFARAASRESELVVRSALGASRGRIVAQLFAEALVLGVVAAIVGLGGAELALRHLGVGFLERNIGTLPFWFDVSLSLPAVIYAGFLTLVAALIAGVVPARKITRGLGSRLKEGTSGAGVQFGGVWTAVIVGQVALTVAFPVLTSAVQREAVRISSYDAGVAANEFLAVSLDMDAGPDTAANRVRFTSSLETLRQRLLSEPAVTGVTFVDRLPGAFHRGGWIEMDSPAERGFQGGAELSDPVVSTALVDASYFDVVGAPILAGRGFGPADLAGVRAVVVDQGFVDRLQGRNPVGRQLRFLSSNDQGATEAGPWYEIVGVVRDLGMGSAMDRDRAAGVYLPGVAGGNGALQMLVHTNGDPLGLGTRVREIAAESDATLRVASLQRLDQINQDMVWIAGFWLKIASVLTAVALALSLAGIYAVMSFTVVRRTREIGVRVALGATPRRVIGAVFRKPLIQVAGGIAIGFILVTAATWGVAGHRPDGQPRVSAPLTMAQIGMLLGFTMATLSVCLLACVVPTRRALRVQPSEALRME